VRKSWGQSAAEKFATLWGKEKTRGNPNARKNDNEEGSRPKRQRKEKHKNALEMLDMRPSQGLIFWKSTSCTVRGKRG